MTVLEIVRLYLAEITLRVQIGALSQGAAAKLSFYLTRFAATFGPQSALECRRTDLTKFLLAHPTWMSNSTKLDAIGIVVSAFRWAEEEGLVEKCPYRKPKLMLTPVQRQPLSDAEYIRLMRAAHRRRYPSGRAFRRALFFLRRAACRPGEMRLLEPGELDAAAGVVRLGKHKTRRRTGAPRIFGIDDCVVRLLVNLERRRGSRPVLFLNGRGRPWTKNSFARIFKAFARRAGLPCKLVAYCLRHGWTVRAIDRGLSDRQIADHLGHSSTRYVAWYGKGSRENLGHLRAIARRANEHA